MRGCSIEEFEARFGQVLSEDEREADIDNKAVLDYATPGGSAAPAGPPPATTKVSGSALESFTRETGQPSGRRASPSPAPSPSSAAKLLNPRRQARLEPHPRRRRRRRTSLAEALAKWPTHLSPASTSPWSCAGEAGGFLHVVLQQIADFRTREQDLKGKVKGAMVYPIVLCLVAIGVLIFLLTFFIPRFSASSPVRRKPALASPEFIVAVERPW